jgi:polyhydroxybutyrate depolymerase
MNAGARAAAAAIALLALDVACRKAEPPPRPRAPAAAEDEAKALVEQARRDVANDEANAPALAAGSVPLHLPMNASADPLPLLVFLHGLGGSGDDLREGLHLDEMAQAFAFAFIVPDGVLDSSGRRFWNASESCCNFDGVEVDHVAALRRWIGEATANPKVDARRVYLIGFSNGGFMAYRAGCEIGSLLAGIVSIAGAGPGATAACHPDKPLDVLQIHGERDPIVKFDGGHLFADDRRPRYPSAEQSVAYWAKVDHCTGKPTPARELDINPRLPGAETVVWNYAGCAGNRVELWKILGGDHSAGLSRYGLKAILDWIAAAPATSAAPSPGAAMPAQ